MPEAEGPPFSTTNVSCTLSFVYLSYQCPLSLSSSSDAQPMGRADTRNPLAQLSSLTSLSPMASFLVLSSFLAAIAIVPPFLGGQ
jgi:hypothetical protein